MPSLVHPRTAGGLALALGLALADLAHGGSVTVRWTAPGDDGAAGRAAAYDLRWSASPIDASNFTVATRVNGLPPPAMAGTAESVRVDSLADGALLYFAVRAADECANWGPISNVAMVRVGGPLAADRWTDEALLGMPVPNPARVGVRFALGGPMDGPLTVAVFDAAGRRVRTLVAGVAERVSALAWDLRDAAGARVPAGSYLVRAVAGGHTRVRRVTVVR